MAFRFAYGRPPAVAAEGMVATSQPLATRAGLRMLEGGGNAADAALAAAAVLSVTEPMSTGIGGDAFAIVWADGVVAGLDAAGPAPQNASPVTPVEERGSRSVTVPGAVAGWAELAARCGKVGLDECLADAIDIAERGFAVASRTAAAWAASGMSAARATARVPAELTPPPARGDRWRMPDLAATLRAVASEGPRALYEGSVAEAICSVSWLEPDDLAGFDPHWVEPLRVGYRGYEVLEMPPPTQGVAALEALGLLEGLKPTLPAQIDCIGLALEDARQHVRDGADVSGLLAPDFLDRRRPQAASPASGPAGGTVYLCAVDRDRMAVSFIQSLFGGFGSGLVAPGTGIVCRTAAAASRCRARSFPASGRTTRSSRACSRAMASSSAPSA